MPANQKASRQKSFFDKDTKVCNILPQVCSNSKRPPGSLLIVQERPPWIRSQWSSNAAHQPEYLARPVPDMAPIAASAESKVKLSAFRLEQSDRMCANNAQNSGVVESEKENTPNMNDQDATISPQSISHVQNLSQKSASRELRDCPQTPVGRLPLAELIAGGEDVSNQALNLTPVERVLWNHSPQLKGQATSRAARKSRKRRHSSSPASSSQNESSSHFPAGKTLDLQNLQNLLKTPQADPASELWSRYSMNTNPNDDKESPGGLAATSFAIHSSPQTPAKHPEPKDLSSLRRSISCSMEWPTSAAKRRRLKYSSSRQEMKVGFGIPNAAHDETGKSKMARVSLLVEEIQHRLSRPHAREDEVISGPSSSSPLPDKSDFSAYSAVPLLKCSQNNKNQIVSEPKHASAVSPNPVRRQFPVDAGNLRMKTSFQEVPSSEFDDDDLDIEILETIDGAKVSPTAAGLSTKLPRLDSSNYGYGSSHPECIITTPDIPPDRKGGMTSNFNSTNPRKEECHLPSAAPIDPTLSHSQPFRDVTGPSYDEFDEDDNEISAADLEGVASMYDTKPQSQDQHFINFSQDTQSLPKSQVRLSGTKVNPLKAKRGQFVAGMAGCEATSDDEFGDGLDFEEIVAECEEASQRPQLASQSQSSNVQKVSTIQRYLIMTIAQGFYNNEYGMKCSEKVLMVQNEKTKLNKAITLRGFWFESPCTSGSYVHLIGDFDQYGQCIVDDSRNLLIIHPDHLISATVVADSFSCTRRAVLQDRVKATSQIGEPTVYGSMLHEIFQAAMKANRWDTEWLSLTIEKVATRYLESLYELNLEFARAVDHLKSKAVDLQAWAEVFVTARPKANAFVKDRNGAQALMSVNKLLDVEEKVWSPLYGLKGMVDATVQVLMQDEHEERTLTVPLEVKTGKFPNAAHKAQTALYTLLLSDRYDVEVMYGILYYTETSEITRIPAVRHELIHMVMQRNELACYVRQRLELPPMLKSAHLCGKCYAQSPCFLYHKLIDDGNGETSGMGEKYDEVTKHLKPGHQQFFQKWDDLITKEEKVVMRFRRELWTMQSTEREKVGRCFGNVVIDPDSVHDEQDGPKINRFTYAFKKQTPSVSFSFTESQITTGEPIVISDEKGHFALASGYVTRVQKHKIYVAVDQQLHNARVRKTGFDAERNQVFTGIMEIVEDGVGQSTVLPTCPEEPVLYRIDKDEFSNGMATVRNNLIQLMEKDEFGAQPLRKLIIEGVAPTFRPTSTPYNLTDSASQASLNVDQERAIEKVMNAKDYALVLGMPGTGKTTTIAHIIRALAAQGKSVLLTSYTHTAVDNILLKIRDAKIGVFRLGNVAKVHPDVQEFSDLAGVPMTTVEEIKSAYSRQVVATTCLGINHPIFNQRVFDYCIVDEASQITLPVCLGPIRMAKKFILVGDHYQLPPLVQNKEALEGGLDISLFKMLSDNHPSSVVSLEHQYRMCEEIMTLSNTLVYNGRLKCGTPAVAKRTITIPNINALEVHHHSSHSFLTTHSKNACLNPARGSCWLRDLVDPSVKACLVNTDALLPASRESQSGSRIVNSCEAKLCTQLVEALITTGVSPSEIGVITLYRSQLALLKQTLRHHQPAVEMHTADKFQGRDKEVVVLSLVRSNEKQNVGDLLKDWRRVNVAFTRARTKLLVVGSASTLRGNELLNRFVTLMEGKGWMYDLPTEAADAHVWEEQMGTQPVLNLGLGLGLARGANGERIEKRAHEGVNRGAKKHILDTRKQGRENRAVGPNCKKGPAKAGKLDVKALMQRRPVLRDILNDAS